MACSICNTTDEQAEWRPVKAWEDLYLVSSDGRVYTKRGRKVMKFGRKEYLEVRLSDGAPVNMFVHLLVASAFIGPRPADYYECNHIDGIKYHNCISNLEWLTRAENQDHAFRTGLRRTSASPDWVPLHYNQGSRQWNAILTEEKVRQIREIWDNSEHSVKKREELASQFGMTPTSITDIIYRRSWTHVQ